MDFEGANQPRVIGDYILGPRIGLGSFAVVWLSRNRHTGLEVAVKEIDKKHLSQKVSENLLKEISILSTINHPNIIRLYEAIQTHDRIFLVLEYCGGGDLAAYIHRHGKVSEAIAQHFMSQLAAGLQVLQEKHLIHRDLKPQNLLLANSEAMPLLKIGDFGFARSLTPQGLADTLCGSPLYMAPEIIQNQKYDAKADLWSVGAILFQLVTGRPPFDGNNQLQLFQNVLTSSELQFPQEALEVLHSECLDLCRSLLRRNPVERLTFREFFNHKFLQESRLTVNVERPSLVPSQRLTSTQLGDFVSDLSQLHPGYDVGPSGRHSGYDVGPSGSNAVVTSSTSDGSGHLSNKPPASPLMESVEEDCVLVNPQFASSDTFSDYFEASVRENTVSRVSIGPSKMTDRETGVLEQTKDPASSHADLREKSKCNELEPSSVSSEFAVLEEVQGVSLMHPSNRLELLHQYVQILEGISQEKYNTGCYQECFAVELVILAIWKKALEISESWLASTTTEAELPGSSSVDESTFSCEVVGLSQAGQQKIDFREPSSVSFGSSKGSFLRLIMQRIYHAILEERMVGLLICFELKGAAEMPDAMEIIFQQALSVGKSGAVEELYGNRRGAAASYSKAMHMLTFIVEEAVHLPLKPPFSLTHANRKRIKQYILKLQSRQLQSSSPASSSKAGLHSFIK